jgi:hypothetical protein
MRETGIGEIPPSSPSLMELVSPVFRRTNELYRLYRVVCAGDKIQLFHWIFASGRCAIS